MGRCLFSAANTFSKPSASRTLPRLNGGPQRTRRGWEDLFHLACSARNGRVVENRDAGNFGNGFFEQL